MQNVTLADILAGGGVDSMDAARAARVKGRKLHPFSGWRYRMADALGLRFFRAMVTAGDDEVMRRDLRNGSYPGVEADAVLVLWICAHTRDEIGWAADPYERQTALDAADAWADGLKICGSIHDDTAEAALKILFDAQEASDADPDEKKKPRGMT